MAAVVVEGGPTAATGRICPGAWLRALTPAIPLVVADLPVIRARKLIRSGGVHRNFGIDGEHHVSRLSQS
jgi:hypothetical protein